MSYLLLSLLAVACACVVTQGSRSTIVTGSQDWVIATNWNAIVDGTDPTTQSDISACRLWVAFAWMPYPYPGVQGLPSVLL